MNLRDAHASAQTVPILRAKVLSSLRYFIENGELGMSEKFSPEFQGSVQLQSALMGLTLAFQKKYGDEAVKVTQAFAEKMGIMIGNRIKEKAGVAGSGVHEVEGVFHAWLDPTLAPRKLETSVEGNKLTVTRENPTVCPAIIVAKQMNLPLEMVCNTVALPMFKGIANSVNPNAKHSSLQMSEQKCIHRIEIP